MLFSSLPSGICMSVNSTLPKVSCYVLGDPYNIGINNFDYYILYVLLVVLFFLLFCL